MFPQLEHSGDRGPTAPPSTPTRCTSGAHQKTQCSLAITQEVEQLGAQERGRKREESRKQLSKHASDFPKWKQRGEGKGWVWKEEWVCKGSALGYECQESISTSLLPSPRPSSHLCPSSRTVLPPAPGGGSCC